MKHLIFSTLLLLIVVSAVFAQPAAERNVINFSSSAFSMCLTPSRQICLATRAGEVVLPSDSADTWMAVPPGNDKNALGGPTIDKINFFNKDTGFVSGFISDRGGSAYNIYYRTVNGGRLWQKLKLPDEGWVDDAVHLNNGEAWLSVSGTGHIDYTVDFGLTWQQLSTPKPKERFAAIFFNARRQGFIGSLWNVLAYTPDNCKTWVSIPTPLDQQAYTKTNIDNRPEINKTAIFNNYLLAEQEGLVFYTKIDEIRWQPLSHCNNFVAGVNEDALFFIAKNRLLKADDNLQPVKQYSLPAGSRFSRYNNGTIAFWDANLVTLIDSTGSITTTPLYTIGSTVANDNNMHPNSGQITNPKYIGYSEKDGEYGYLAGKLYTQKEYNSGWVYKTSLPFYVGNGLLHLVSDDSLLLETASDTLLYYNLKNQTIRKTTGRDMLEKFCSRPVSTVVFETGSSGCFHRYADNVVYERNSNGDFELTDHGPHGSQHTSSLGGFDDAIDSKKVDEFIKGFPVSIHQPPTVETLGFTQQDYATAKKDIQDFEKYVHKNKSEEGIEAKGFRLYENNIDFKRLLSLLDSIPNLTPQKVDNFSKPTFGMYSTTTNWVSIKFVNDKGELLTIENLYYDPNSLHFPWRVTLNGYTVTENPISVNKFIDAVYPSFIQSKGHADIIETFVKRLYSWGELE